MELKRSELVEIICEVYKIDKLTSLIERQISDFVTQKGLTYKQIAQALVFYIEEDNGDYKENYGIGIVPLYVNRAEAFFAAKRIRLEKKLESLKNLKSDIILESGNMEKRKKKYPIDITKIE